MIEPRIFEDRVMISSVDLYKALGREHERYNKWIKRVISGGYLNTPRDFFIYKKPNRRLGKPLEIYFTTQIAKFICFKENTVVGKNIRFHIQDHIEDKIKSILASKRR